MISSRWPRPMGMSASIALMPVWTGVSTPLRAMTPGAIRSTGRVRVALIGPLSSSGRPERVDDAPEQLRADRHLDDAAGRLDDVAFLDRRGVAEDDRADGLLLEVEGHAHDAAGELEQLRRERAVEAVDLGDAVADLDDRPDVARLGGRVEVLDRGLDDADDLVGSDGHRSLQSVAAGRWSSGAAVGRVSAGSGDEAVAEPLEASPHAGVDERSPTRTVSPRSGRDRRLSGARPLSRPTPRSGPRWPSVSSAASGAALVTTAAATPRSRSRRRPYSPAMAGTRETRRAPRAPDQVRSCRQRRP